MGCSGSKACGYAICRSRTAKHARDKRKAVEKAKNPRMSTQSITSDKNLEEQVAEIERAYALLKKRHMITTTKLGDAYVMSPRASFLKETLDSAGENKKTRALSSLMASLIKKKHHKKEKKHSKSKRKSKKKAKSRTSSRESIQKRKQAGKQNQNLDQENSQEN